MKAILEFSLPEDRDEYHWANNAVNLHSAIVEFDRVLRDKCKYAEGDTELSAIRLMLYDCLQDKGIDLYL
jgi:hypothetical protein